MDDEKRAKDAITKLALRRLNPLKKAITDKVEDEVTDFTEENLGIDKASLEKALMMAEIARSGRVKGKHRLGDNTTLEGELDFKNKGWKLGLKHDF